MSLLLEAKSMPALIIKPRHILVTNTDALGWYITSNQQDRCLFKTSTGLSASQMLRLGRSCIAPQTIFQLTRCFMETFLPTHKFGTAWAIERYTPASCEVHPSLVWGTPQPHVRLTSPTSIGLLLFVHPYSGRLLPLLHSTLLPMLLSLLCLLSASLTIVLTLCFTLPCFPCCFLYWAYPLLHSLLCLLSASLYRASHASLSIGLTLCITLACFPCCNH